MKDLRRERISETLGCIGDGWIEEAAAYTARKRTLFAVNFREKKVQKERKPWKIQKKLLAAAAGAAAMLLLTVGLLQSGLFGQKTDILTLQGEETMRFAPFAALLDGNWDMIGDPRGMTAAEAQICFGDREVDGAFLFAPGEQHPYLFEGQVDGVHLTAFAGGVGVDRVLEGEYGAVSRIQGVDVRAGYHLTDRNSRGERWLVCLAEFECGGYHFALELAGDESEREALEKTVAELTLYLIERGGVPLAEITR